MGTHEEGPLVELDEELLAEYTRSLVALFPPGPAGMVQAPPVELAQTCEEGETDALESFITQHGPPRD